MHGEAVATVLSFDGITVLCWVLLEELLELDDEEAVHGGTISVVTLLLAGSTSVLTGVPPELEPPEPPLLDPEPPPGVSRTVLDGGGLVEPLEPLLLLELELELGAMHGWTATVWVSEPGGIVISFDPGGGLKLPDCATCASEHGGTTIVTGWLCFDTWTVLTPGFWSAVCTASELELDELDPHPATPSAAAATVTATRREPIVVIHCLP